MAHLAPLSLASMILIQCGEKWGGKLPLRVNLAYGLIDLCCVIGIILSSRLLYQMLFNKHYDGRKGSIRGQLCISLGYVSAGLILYLALNQFSGDPSCTLNTTQELWDSSVYDEGNSAYSNFCHSCKCLIQSEDITFYSKTLLFTLNYSTTQGAANIAGCEQNSAQISSSTFSKLQTMESNYGCAGFCSANPTFTFIGTQNGIPSSGTGCLKQIGEDFTAQKDVTLILAIIYGVYYIIGYFSAQKMRKIKLTEILTSAGMEEPLVKAQDSFGHQEDNRTGDLISQPDRPDRDLSFLVPSHSSGQDYANCSEDIKKHIQIKKLKATFRSMNTPRTSIKIQ